MKRIGRKMTEEHRKKISEAKKGHEVSEETRQRLREFNMGHKVSKETREKIGKAQKGRKVSEESRRKMCEVQKGRVITEEHKRKLSKAHMGKRLSKETRDKMSKNSYRWKGGITPENIKIRRSVEYRLWREAVFARDNWTCQKTGKKGLELQAHHLQNFSDYPELRFAIDNGVTLSKKAHIEFHRAYGIKNNTREQMKQYLS